MLEKDHHEEVPCQQESIQGTHVPDEARESTSDGFGEATKPTSQEAVQGAAAMVTEEPKEDSIYHVKWIRFKGQKYPTVTQNVNGPCPLLSIVNILLLRGKVTLPEGCEVISSEQLMQRVGDTLLNSLPSNLSSADRLNLEQNVSDAMTILPKLQTGLDVNVQFVGVSSFEFTPTLVIFDLLQIHLYHGWLVDPQETVVSEAVGNLGYNQLVEKIITNKNSTDGKLVIIN